jgi:AraC-like DNA-binding protein
MLKPNSTFYSTSLNAAPALLNTVEKVGGDGDEMVRRAGLPCSAGVVRSRRTEEISRDKLTSLYRECVLFLESHTCARDHRPQWPTENYEIVCFCLIGCPNLSEALARTRDFFDALAASQCEISIMMSRDVTTFSLNSHRLDAGPSAFVTDLVGTASFQRLFSWLIGENLPVIESGTIYPELLWEPSMASIAPPDLRFGQPSNYFSFPSSYLNKRLVRSYSDVSNMRGAIPWTFMLPMDYANDFPSTVRVLLNSSLRNGDQIPDLNQLARKLGCSTRTLRRRLSNEAISLNTLKNECRLEIATDLLRNSSLTVEQIASRVSFSDAIVFRRAFKRWTGVSPSDFRHGDGTS